MKYVITNLSLSGSRVSSPISFQESFISQEGQEVDITPSPTVVIGGAQQVLLRPEGVRLSLAQTNLGDTRTNSVLAQY